jgi:cytochrome c-type biogenesis protein CcmH/NrfF
MVGGFLWVLWFLPALKLVAMILLKVALKHQKFKKNQSRKSFGFSSFCNLQRRVRTHAVMAIGLYELLGNPTI